MMKKTPSEEQLCALKEQKRSPWTKEQWDAGCDRSFQPAPPIALAGLLSTPEKIQDIAELPHPPIVEEANVIPYPGFNLPANNTFINDRGLIRFCRVNLAGALKIMRYAETEEVMIKIDGKLRMVRIAVKEKEKGQNRAEGGCMD